MQSRKPKRLILEEDILTKLPPDGVTIKPDPDNNLKWEILILAPMGTPYEGGTFRLSCIFPENYPFKPPRIKFNTKIYHPSVFKYSGEIDTVIYEDNWVHTRSLEGLIQIIIKTFFLNEFDVNFSLEWDIAEEYRKNRALFNKNAADWTRKYATLGTEN